MSCDLSRCWSQTTICQTSFYVHHINYIPFQLTPWVGINRKFDWHYLLDTFGEDPTSIWISLVSEVAATFQAASHIDSRSWPLAELILCCARRCMCCADGCQITFSRKPIATTSKLLVAAISIAVHRALNMNILQWWQLHTIALPVILYYFFAEVFLCENTRSSKTRIVFVG